MKKLTILFLAVALLCGCASRSDTRTEEIRKQLLALPAVEELTELPLEEQREIYDKIQEIYDDYVELTAKAQEAIPEAEGIFASLFGYFNSLIMPLPET